MGGFASVGASRCRVTSNDKGLEAHVAPPGRSACTWLAGPTPSRCRSVQDTVDRLADPSDVSVDSAIRAFAISTHSLACLPVCLSACLPAWLASPWDETRFYAGCCFGRLHMLPRLAQQWQEPTASLGHMMAAAAPYPRAGG
jgi:hypothetical protein